MVSSPSTSRPFFTRAALLLALLPGCFGVPELLPITGDETESEGETEEEEDSGESEGTTDDDAESSTGGASTDPNDESSSSGDDEDRMELLSNGSFESWTGGMPNAWAAGDAALEELVDDGTDGDRSVRVVSMTYNSIGQFVDMDVPAGSCLDVELALRWDSGDTVAPVVQVVGRAEAANDIELFADVEWTTDGEWIETQRSFVAEAGWIGIKIAVLSNSPTPQAFALDDVSLAIVPCD